MIKNEQGMGKATSVTPKKRLRINNKKIFYYSLLAYPLLQFCIFYIGVNFQSVLFAFQKYENNKFVFLTEDILGNFKDIINHFGVKDNTVLWAFQNSVILWVFSIIFGMGIAIFFSYYIFKRVKTGRFFRFVLFLPSILPGVLLCIIFKLFTSDVLPVLFGCEKLLETTDDSIRLTTIIAYNIFLGFGTQVLLYSNSMEQISPSVLEAAQLDGITPLRELWLIIVPSIMGTISTFVIASIAGMFTSQANLYNFYGESGMNFPRTNTLGYYMFVIVQPGSMMGFGRDYYGYASALGLCCTAVVIVPTVLFRKFSKKFEE